MTEKIKNYLGIAIIIGVLVLAFSALGYVRTFSKSVEPSSFRSFTVTGEGRVVAKPDIARFTWSLISEGADLSALQTDNSNKSNAVIKFLKDEGIDEKDIRTEQYQVSPRYETVQCAQPAYYRNVGAPITCPPAKIVGYSVTQTVSVKVRDFAKIGGLLSGVVEKGANSVSELAFTIDDPSKIENEARAKAIEQGKEKAKVVARAGDFGIGRLLGIDEGYMPFYTEKSVRNMAFDMAEGAMAAPAPSVEPGSQEVVVSVTLRYEID